MNVVHRCIVLMICSLFFSFELSATVSQKVKKTLLALHPVTAAAKAGKYMGWVNPRDYSSVRKLMQRLEVGPYAKKQ